MAGEQQGTIFIALIEIPPAIEAKIRGKYPSLTGAEVKEALQWPAKTDRRWEDHPVHGLRVIAHGATSSGRRILAAVHPVDAHDGHWRLRTARAEGN